MKELQIRQKAEAILRMKSIGLLKEAITDFEKYGTVNISERPFGTCYWADKKMVEKIKTIEKRYGVMIYHGSHTNFEFGECYEFLYVSDSPSEWEDDRRDLTEGCPVAYVLNIDDEYSSEFGCIGIKITQAQGIVRVE